MSYGRLLGPNMPCSADPPMANSADRTTAVRNVLVHINGNRVTWEHLGVHGAMWRVNADHADSIFSYTHDASLTANGTNATVDDDRLSRAMIKRVTLLESNTNIDEVVGVVVDGLPSHEFTANGMGASCFLTGAGRVTESRDIFSLSGNTELGMAWMQQYPKYTTENLESEGTMLLQGATYYFVHDSHPALQMLHTTQDDKGLQLANDPPDDAGWYKIDVETFLLCVKTLRDGVLRHTPSTFNLSGLTIRLCKPDRQSWLHMSAPLIDQLVFEKCSDVSEDQPDYAAAKKGVISRYLDRPVFVTLRLSIEYTLPDATPPESCTPSKAPSIAAVQNPPRTR